MISGRRKASHGRKLKSDMRRCFETKREMWQSQEDKRRKRVSELHHDGKDILTFHKATKIVDKTKIRYEHKVQACFDLGLIDKALKSDLWNCQKQLTRNIQKFGSVPESV